MRAIFEINPKTLANKGKTVKYCEGPIKEMARCKAKAENDYSREEYPTCAKVLDFVRCSMVFASCEACVDGIRRLEDAVKSRKWCIRKIGRIKNMLCAIFSFANPCK